MNGMGRAKALLKGRAKRTALTIVPLAVAAMQAHAGVLLNPSLSFGSGIFDGLSQNVGSISTAALPAVGGVTGVRGWGSGTTSVSGGGYIQMYMNGSMTGPLDPNTTVAFETSFSVSELGVKLDISHAYRVAQQGNLQFADSNLNVTGSASASFVGNVSNQFVGLQLDLSALSGLSPIGWSSTLTICADNGSNGCLLFGPQMTLDVPQNSMDVTGLAATNGVPEPSTWLLLSSGLGGLLLWRRRRFLSWPAGRDLTEDRPLRD